MIPGGRLFAKQDKLKEVTIAIRGESLRNTFKVELFSPSTNNRYKIDIPVVANVA